MSPDGLTVASGSPGETTRLWSTQTRAEAPVVSGSSAMAGFSGDGRMLVLAPEGPDYRWYLIESGKSRSIPAGSEPPLKFDFLSRPYDVTGNAPLAVLGRSEGTVELWDLALGSKIASWRAGVHEITAAVFSPNGTLLATGDAGGSVKVWNTTTHRPAASTHLFNANARPVLAFSADGQYLAIATQNQWGKTKVRFWDFAKGSSPAVHPASSGPVRPSKIPAARGSRESVPR